MELQPKEVLKAFRLRRVMLPVFLGLGVTFYLIFSGFSKPIFLKSVPGKGEYVWQDNNHNKRQEADEFVKSPDNTGDYMKQNYLESIKSINWTWISTFWICITLLMMVVRDFAYMVRIRVLTESQITWGRSFIVIMVWEFASAVVPALLGGGFVFAVFILNREKVNMGKSITAVMLSSFLDGLFFAIVAPLTYYMAGKDNLFSSVDPNSINAVSFGKGLFYFFWLVYFCVLAYKVLIAYALFINPNSVKRLLIRIFSIRFLRKWRLGALDTGNQLLIASSELKNKHVKFWLGAFGATVVSWTARFTIVNCLILAFHDVKIDNAMAATTQVIPINDFIVYARQVVMGIIMLGSPTPGGSGVAEFMFTDFLSEFIPMGLASTLGFIWRLVSYYPYLIIGAIILPRWIKRVFLTPPVKTGG